MKRRNSALAAATAAFAFVACSSQMRSAGSEFQFATDAAAIKATLDTTTAGWNRGELPVYLSAYADSATAMGSTGLVRGVRGIEGQMRAGFWRTGRPLQTLSYDHLEIRPIGPNQAIVTGQYILSGGGRPDRTGWFTTIWVRIPPARGHPSGWRIVHDHSS
ncbi:MAG TPA: nuclear transport factor 2 family protein [Gemmatimonadaceae bacterium]